MYDSIMYDLRIIFWNLRENILYKHCLFMSLTAMSFSEQPRQVSTSAVKHTELHTIKTVTPRLGRWSRRDQDPYVPRPWNTSSLCGLLTDWVPGLANVQGSTRLSADVKPRFWYCTPCWLQHLERWREDSLSGDGTWVLDWGKVFAPSLGRG